MRRHRRDKQAPTRFSARAGLFLMGLALVGILYPLWWTHRSTTAGHLLLSRARIRYTEALKSRHHAACPTSAAPAGPIGTVEYPGVLGIPSLNVQAPVLQGLGNAVLQVAVGHDARTVWPGARGESLLLAHDVSYFSGLGRTKIGAIVTWTSGCERFVFRVVGTQVMRPGERIAPPPSGTGLALITCWPANALFWTPYRFVVETSLVSTEHLSRPDSAPLPSVEDLAVPVPVSLAKMGLSINQVGIPVGTLTILGPASPSFRQGPDPLALEVAALRDYAGLYKAAQAGNHTWWSAMAMPNVSLPAPWSLFSTTDVTMVVHGMTVSRFIISSSYVRVTLIVLHHTLYVAEVAR